jgi:hypothetical protein
MKFYVALMMMGLGAVTQAVPLPSGWIRSITIATISDNDIDGEVVLLTVNEVVDNPAHCADSTGYAIRDPNTLRSSLALLMSAFVTGKQVDLFVTGSCDKTGMPAVSGVTLRK